MGTITPRRPPRADLRSHAFVPLIAVLALFMALIPRTYAQAETPEATETAEVVVDEGVTTEGVEAPAPTMWTTTTDGTPATDFPPGATVLVHGANFPGGIDLDLPITRPDGTIVRGDGTFSCTGCWDTITTTADGAFTYGYILNGIEGPYTVEAFTSPWAGPGSEDVPLATLVFTDKAGIHGKVHQGQQKPSGAWTNGNTTEFVEGDWVNFRFTVDSHGPRTGQMAIHFSNEGAGCHFFKPQFELGNWDYGTGALGAVIETLSGTETLTVTPTGAITPIHATEWQQLLNLTTSGDGEWRVNYRLFLTDNVTGCTGSSQHSRLQAGPEPGDYEQTGEHNVPVPASAVIRLPDIDVIKMIDRDGDGSYESTASAGEFSFDLGNTYTAVIGDDPQTTDASGEVHWQNIEPDGSYTITESQVDFSQGTYAFVGLDAASVNCALVSETITATIAAGDINQVEHATCIVLNRALTGTITINKVLDPPADAGLFDLEIDGTAEATDVGNGGTTGAVTVFAGTRQVSESAGTNTSLTDYSSSWACVDAAGAPIASGDGAGPLDVVVADGDAIVCTVTNIRLGSIAGLKFDDLDGDGVRDAGEPPVAGIEITLTGDVDGDGSDEQLVDTTDTNGEFVFTGLMPDTYQVAEAVPAGAVATTASSVEVPLAAGQVIDNIEFGNAWYGSISGYKFEDLNGNGIDDGEPRLEGVTIELDGTTGLGATVSESVVTGASGAFTFASLMPGNYTIAEIVPAGWQATTVTSYAETLLSGEVVTGLAFGNAEEGSISGYKFEDLNGNGVDDGEPRLEGVTIELTGTTGLGATVDLQTVTASDGSFSFTGLVPGEYSVEEVVPAGTAPTTPTSQSVTLASGEAVTDIVFGNAFYGAITLAKVSYPAASGFEFDVSANLSSGNIELDSGQMVTFTGLLPGVYTMTELVSGNWDLTDLTCAVTGDGGSSYSIVEPTATITLRSGDRVDCSFENTHRGTITVEKVTLPDGDSAMFTFEVSYQGTDLLIGDGQSDTSVHLVPGVYTVTELVPAGWDLTGLVCVDNTGGTTVDLGNATATVTLDPGDAVVCTFTDTKRGSITIVKEDVSTFDNLGDGDDFAFTGDLGAFTLDDPDVDDADGITDTFAVANLLPGVYAITETLVPDDNPLDLDGPWALGEIVCTGADAVAADATITITLDPGEDAECIFRNLQTEIIPPPFIIGDFVWNDVNDNGLQDPGEIGIGGVAVDLLDTSSTVLASTVTDAAGKYSFAVADPGTYVLRFTTPFDFDITDALVGIDPAVDSNLLPNGLTPEVEVTIADMLGVGSNLTIDAGFVRIPEIPETGADTDRLAGLAGVLLLGGILLLVLSRRRRSTI